MAWSSATSDSEDSNILDEIRDLENILATTPANPESLQKSSFEAIYEPCGIDTISEDPNDSKDFSLDHVTVVFNLNKQLIEELTNAKHEVSAILEDCNKKLQMIDHKIKEYAKNWTDNSKIVISTAGIPYFKDKDYFGAPKNDDAKLKIARGELQIVHFQKSCIWTARDKETLLNAVYDEATISILNNSKKKEKEKTTLPQGIVKGVLLEGRMEGMIGALGEKQFDWLKIAAMTFDDKHSADECCIMWNVLLHPDINKGKWTQTEELNLKKIAKLYGYNDWDKIAKKLNTKRTGYQCAIKYNYTKLSKLAERTWTTKEDERLYNVVSKCKIGNFIPWNQVMSYMNVRCKDQIYFRWMLRLSPHLKKGRFTKEESETLLQGVNKLGTDFTLIATQLMPDRSAVQLNDHYQTLMSRESPCHWTVSSDMKLIYLYNQLGPDWCKIAKNFKYKNRTQVRHRYTSLYKYISKGLSIFEIPRQKNENSMKLKDTEPDDEEYNIEETENDINDKIDQLLIEHFQNLNTIEPFHEESLYDSEELFKDTKELYSILEYLQANLHIPDNFNYLPLMEGDKQLLYSLKAYIKLKFERQNSTEIEAVRLKMFGSEDSGKEKHFIPPLPHEVYSNLKNDKRTECIDYVFDVNTNFLVDVETELNTPESIICLIGGLEQNIQFDKISNLQCIVKEKCEQKKMFCHIDAYRTSSFCKNINPLPSSSTVEKLSNQSTNTLLKFNQSKHEIKKNNDLIFKTHAEMYESINKSSNGVTCLDHKKELVNMSGPLIKPDYITLLCCRNFITLKNIYDIEKIFDIPEDHQDVEKKHKSERAYELLKKRLIKLFKYPIYMSRLALKEINDTMGLFSIESKNIVHKKRKGAQKNICRRKKIKTNRAGIFLYESNANIQVLNKSTNC
ncbi:hypothetical protein KPH14_002435 [Odynerus spinipes]|uniref:snRNA-activating protein complex subunit 4 n=1 Tax=Odynerus spinipes TaxID=1348599 RepID=A0AAD9VQ54_9HYME|nr:hypothetical protein KPH14_002435 [Odynerus spinipes]